MKKFLMIFFLVFNQLCTFAFQENDAKLFNVVISIQNSQCLDKNILSNVLNLTDEQREQNKEFLESDNCSELYNKLDQEKELLKCMENCPFLKVVQQKLKIKKLKSEIIKDSKKGDKAFKKTLNHHQRSKYSMIKKLQRWDIYRDEEDYYKKNPQMVPFGNQRYK